MSNNSNNSSSNQSSNMLESNEKALDIATNFIHYYYSSLAKEKSKMRTLYKPNSIFQLTIGDEEFKARSIGDISMIFDKFNNEGLSLTLENGSLFCSPIQNIGFHIFLYGEIYYLNHYHPIYQTTILEKCTAPDTYTIISDIVFINKSNDSQVNTNTINTPSNVDINETVNEILQQAVDRASERKDHTSNTDNHYYNTNSTNNNINTNNNIPNSNINSAVNTMNLNSNINTNNNLNNNTNINNNVNNNMNINSNQQRNNNNFNPRIPENENMNYLRQRNEKSDLTNNKTDENENTQNGNGFTLSGSESPIDMVDGMKTNQMDMPRHNRNPLKDGFSIVIKDLPQNITREVLSPKLEEFGRLEYIYLNTTKTNPFAFATYINKSDCDKLFESLSHNPVKINEKPIRIDRYRRNYVQRGRYHRRY